MSNQEISLLIQESHAVNRVLELDLPEQVLLVIPNFHPAFRATGYIYVPTNHGIDTLEPLIVVFIILGLDPHELTLALREGNHMVITLFEPQHDE